MPYKDPEKQREYSRRKYAENSEKQREYSRRKYAENSEKVREYARRRYAENPEKALEKNLRWRVENQEKVRESSRRRYAENPERAREYARRRYAENPEKALEETRRWNENNPEKLYINRRRHILKKYGLSDTDYGRMEAAQGGVCAICGVKPERKLCVDHNHASGAVRQLLCNICNVGLGHVEKPGWLEKALAYLERHREAPSVSPEDYLKLAAD